MAGFHLFIREAITNPLGIGALVPSSKRLAYAIAQQITHYPFQPESGLIVELGAGTGAITEALAQQKNSQQELIIIEKSIKMAHHLKQRFPTLTTIQGDAQALQQLLSPYQAPVQAIISSLPLRSLPKTIVQRIGTEIENLLKTGGLFVQYTYSLWGKPTVLSAHLKLVRQYWVWQNLPPARIDVYHYQ
jgi:phosphatidylethanolamine/phosphatidyl-N-methylethanolamine N-methyltransferase